MLLVIVRNFDVVRSIRFPHKANASLIIDANAVLALAVAFQRLQLIAAVRGVSYVWSYRCIVRFKTPTWLMFRRHG